MSATVKRPWLPWALAAAGIVSVVAARLHYALRPEDIPNPYALTHLTIAVTSIPVGAWVASRRPAHPVGWVLLTAGLLGAWMYAAQPLWVELWLLDSPSWLLRMVSVNVVWAWLVARSLLLIAAPSVTPDGWPVGPRRWILRAAIVDTVVLCLAQIVTQWGSDFGGRPLPDGAFYRAADVTLSWASKGQWALGVAAVLGLAVGTLRAPDPAVRRQTRLFTIAAALLAVPAISVLGASIWPNVSWPGDQWERLASGLLPLALAAAVVFDHLLDVRVVVRRAVLFAGLTAVGAAVYASLTGIVTAAIDLDGNVQRALAAGLTALVLIPTFRAWHGWVDRHIYGDTSRPERVIAQLGRDLGAAESSHRAVERLVATLRDALKLPYVAVELHLGPGLPPQAAAQAGTPIAPTETFPIHYAGDTVGRLVVGQRTAAEPLRPAERELLGDLAGHVGVVLHDAHLEAQLRTSREQIVRAREEERRRLRGDLHDGLGPTLASVALGLDAASARVDDPALAGLLTELNNELHAAIDDVRRLVYNLRPPALDELGLVRAVEQHARAVQDRSPGLTITVDACELPTLPAAIEVAAYRITMEAISNVSRHAHARTCTTQLIVTDGALCVDVIDDGVGLPADRRSGIGLTSMRERADELQGSLLVEPLAAGTHIRAVLPLERLGTA